MEGAEGVFLALVGFFLGLGLDPHGGVFLLGVPGGVVGSCALLPFPPFPLPLLTGFLNFLWTVLS